MRGKTLYAWRSAVGPATLTRPLRSWATGSTTSIPATAHNRVHDRGGAIIVDDDHHVVDVGAYPLGGITHGGTKGHPLDHRDVVHAIPGDNGPTRG